MDRPLSVEERVKAIKGSGIIFQIIRKKKCIQSNCERFTMPNVRNAASLFILCLIVRLPLAQAQGTYTTIDAPGAIHTTCFAINTKGDILGQYSVESVWHGFLLSDGVFTSINLPHNGGTFVYGMNDKGDVVGYGTSGNTSTGFSYDMLNHTFRRINFPGASSTIPTAINNAGMVAGWFNDGSGFAQGFERIGSSYSKIVPTGADGAYLRGITSSGEVVGTSINPQNGVTNFTQYQGIFQGITIAGYPSAQVLGVSPDGSTLVGGYASANLLPAGFIYRDNIFQE